MFRRVAAGTSRPLLHVRRVTNTSEEIYKNLGLQMPTGKEEDEEVEGGHQKFRIESKVAMQYTVW